MHIEQRVAADYECAVPRDLLGALILPLHAGIERPSSSTGKNIR